MFKKYHDTPAAIAICLVILLLIFGPFMIVPQILNLFFPNFINGLLLGELELSASVSEIVNVRTGYSGLILLGFAVGLIRTFGKGPDGQSIFFHALLVVAVANFVGTAYGAHWKCVPVPENYSLACANDSVEVVTQFVMLGLILFAYFRLRSRL